jgi:PAS domain S-box-containing protein
MSAQLLAQMEKRGEIMVHSLATNLANPLYISDMAAMHELLSAANGQKDVVSAWVYDRDGTIAHDGTEELALLGKNLASPEVLTAMSSLDQLVKRPREDACEVVYPIVIGDETIGCVKITLSLAGINADIAAVDAQLASIGRDGVRRPLETLAFIIAGLVVLAVLISISLGKSLAEPIGQLAQFATRVGQGDYSPLSASSRKDEIGELFTAFRTMGEDLKQTTVSKDYVEGIISSMTDCLAILRPDGKIERVNQALCVLLDYTEEELVGRAFVELIASKDEDMQERIDALTAAGTPISQDGLYLKKNGQSVPVAIATSSMRDVASQELRIVCIAKDITERVASENALRYRVRREQHISSISSQFISHSPEQLAAGINHALLHLGEFAGADRSFVSLYADDGTTVSATYEWCAPGIQPDSEQLQALLAAPATWSTPTLASDDIIHIRSVADLSYSLSDIRGELEAENIHSLVAVPMRINDSRIGTFAFASVHREMASSDDIIPLLRIVGEIFTNAVARQRGEQERNALEDQVLHSQKLESLGVLTGGIAHDFNNLLAGILGNAELAILDLPTESLGIKYVEKIKTGGSRAADLINQMLAYSGHGKRLVEPINLNALVNEMRKLIDVSIPKKVDLVSNLAEQLPAMRGDATQIRQIVMNLITNAADAIGNSTGTITLTTSLIQVDKRYLATTYLSEDLELGDYIELTVSDTGCGMSRETKARLFDPFYSTKFTGRGLGLASVLGIAKGHKGTVRVDSEVGVGTKFSVAFPAEAAIVNPGADAASTSVTWKGQGLILVVDDEEPLRDLATAMLSKLGFETLTAEDGGEAVERYKEYGDKISAVFLDFTMPVMNGDEVFAELLKVNPDVKVVLASGHGETEVAPRFPADACVCFISKPYRYRELAEAMRKTLGE